MDYQSSKLLGQWHLLVVVAKKTLRTRFGRYWAPFPCLDQSYAFFSKSSILWLELYASIFSFVIYQENYKFHLCFKFQTSSSESSILNFKILNPIFKLLYFFFGYSTIYSMRLSLTSFNFIYLFIFTCIYIQ